SSTSTPTGSPPATVTPSSTAAVSASPTATSASDATSAPSVRPTAPAPTGTADPPAVEPGAHFVGVNNWSLASHSGSAFAAICGASDQYLVGKMTLFQQD